MLKITQVKLPVIHTGSDIKKKIIKELRLNKLFAGDIPSFSYEIIRRSIDARKKPEIFYVYSIAVDFHSSGIENSVLKRCANNNVSIYDKVIYRTPDMGSNKLNFRPIIVGSGPAGLFAAFILAERGYRPIIIERGAKVDKRVDIVNNFWAGESVDKNTNVQFGEGGAGTFSDGKLNTVVKDPSGKNQFVLDTFVKFGAKPEVAYDSKPHVGTDTLRNVVKNMREYIINHRGHFINLCKVTDLVTDDSRIKAVIVDNYSGEEYDLSDGLTIKKGINSIETDIVILAIGHSARDTFRMLLDKGFDMQQKNFAVGLRIEHPQSLINDIQYGIGHSESLPQADYKLTNKASNGKNVYSFCMCPGGFVVNASSEENRLCVNGMSNSLRDEMNANSALIVNVDSEDFGSNDVLAGMNFQERLEEIAYNIGDGKIPVQCFIDYKLNRITEDFLNVYPVTKGNYKKSNLRELFSDNINAAIIESIEKFGYTMKGFDSDGALLFGIEARTSSPVRIVRNEMFESNFAGVYPCGEGAGYAGGITSAAIDGIKIAEAIIKKYKSF